MRCRVGVGVTLGQAFRRFLLLCDQVFPEKDAAETVITGSIMFPEKSQRGITGNGGSCQIGL